jgi:hypothetical protein
MGQPFSGNGPALSNDRSSRECGPGSGGRTGTSGGAVEEVLSTTHIADTQAFHGAPIPWSTHIVISDSSGTDDLDFGNIWTPDPEDSGVVQFVSGCGFQVCDDQVQAPEESAPENLQSNQSTSKRSRFRIGCHPRTRRCWTLVITWWYRGSISVSSMWK